MDLCFSTQLHLCSVKTKTNPATGRICIDLGFCCTCTEGVDIRARGITVILKMKPAESRGLSFDFSCH